MGRTLIAGFGNALRGDDGFGVEVVRRLEAESPFGSHVQLLEVGTGGIRLAQDLLTPCDRLIIVDAMCRGGAPGTIYVLQVEAVEQVQDIDLHLAVPARVLGLAQALGIVPAQVFLVGCEPLEVDELTMELSPLVEQAVDAAIRHIRDLVPAGDSIADPAASPRRALP